MLQYSLLELLQCCSTVCGRYCSAAVQPVGSAVQPKNVESTDFIVVRCSFKWIQSTCEHVNLVKNITKLNQKTKMIKYTNKKVDPIFKTGVGNCKSVVT